MARQHPLSFRVLDPSLLADAIIILYQIQLSLESGPECQICQLVATELEKQLGVNKTEKEILKAVENVCSYLPGSYKDECDSFVDTYGQEIISALNDKISPANLCTSLGVCSQMV